MPREVFASETVPFPPLVCEQEAERQNFWVSTDPYLTRWSVGARRPCSLCAAFCWFHPH